MANIKDYIKKVMDGTVSLEEQQAALAQVEKTIVEAKQRRDESVGQKADMVVQALKTIEAKLEAKLVELNNTPAMQGVQGPTGKAGKDGVDGKDGLNGVSGKDGKDGKDGVDGKDGISVVDAKIDFDGSLVVYLSNGAEIDCGQILSPDVAQNIIINSGGSGTSQSVTDTLVSLQAQIDALGGGGGSGTVTSITAGSGLSGGTITTSGTIALDINGLTSTTVASTDLVPVYDVSASANADCLASDIAGLGVGVIGYANNRYYFPYLMSGSSGTIVQTINRIHYVPFFVRQKTTFTRIGIEVTILSGTSARLGIYNAANGVPTSLLLDCGTISTASIGQKEATISQSLNVGFYFLALVCDGNPAIYITTNTTSSSSYAIGQSTRIAVTYSYYAANGSITLPNPAQTSLSESSSGVPAISLRVV